MRIKSLICVLLILFASCNRQPETPCDCYHTGESFYKSMHEKDSVLQKFDPTKKENYKSDLDELLSCARKMDKMAARCKNIVRAQGFCKDHVAVSFWDMGAYLDDVNEERLKTKYSGNWEKDSTEKFKGSRFFPRMWEKDSTERFKRLRFIPKMWGKDSVKNKD